MNKNFKNKQAEEFYNEYQKLSEFKKITVRYVIKRKQKHRFHIVAPSPWPIFSAGSAFVFVMGMIFWMHFSDSIVLIFGIILICMSFYFWFKDIIREGVYMGYHTRVVERSLRLGFMLFLVSEVMFFFGFFWALMHFSLTGEWASGNIWPPEGIVHHFFYENLNTVYDTIGVTQDTLLYFLNPYFSQSLFTHLFGRTRSFLDYELSRTTLLSCSNIDDMVRYTFDWTNKTLSVPREWLYLNLATYYMDWRSVSAELASYETGYAPKTMVWKRPCVRLAVRLLSLDFPSILVTKIDKAITKFHIFRLVTADNYPLSEATKAKMAKIYNEYPSSWEYWSGMEHPNHMYSYYAYWVRDGLVPIIEGNRDPILFVNGFSSGLLINPYKVPLLNTLLLVTSGACLTASHLKLRLEQFWPCKMLIILTIMFGLLFFYHQVGEYLTSAFSMNDGIYGSLFFVLTGFHGLHVIVGTIFLIVCCLRLFYSHFTAGNHFAFEAAAWYWHFVDVVWILLFLLLYLWPSARYFGGHTVDIVLNKCTEFYKPEIYFNINVNKTLYYKALIAQTVDPRALEVYKWYWFSTKCSPLSHFIEKYWNQYYNFETTVSRGVKLGFFTETIYPLWFKIEKMLFYYFGKYYAWSDKKLIADHFINKNGGMDRSYSYASFVKRNAWDGVNQYNMGTTTCTIYVKPVVYGVPAQFWTCHVNKHFSVDGYLNFDRTIFGHHFFPPEFATGWEAARLKCNAGGCA
jgi:heme/copper-type cytochrome/quinol oxidase subunit 3